MSLEGQLIDRKSLRTVSGKKANFKKIGKDCIAFVNAQGGKLLIGIEDGEIGKKGKQRHTRYLWTKTA